MPAAKEGPLDWGFDIPEGVEERIDLHLHSNRSDGRLEPAKVIERAGAEGLKAVALTDHDTLGGLAEAEEAAADLGLPFVPGIEFSAYDRAGSTHLLGYFVATDNREFNSFLRTAKEKRLRRAAVMVEKLNRLGVEVTLQDVQAQAIPDGTLTRPHVARAMVEGGWVRTYREAFDRYIAAGQPAYEATHRVDPAEGISRIHEAGGLAVLAHPGKTHGDTAIRQLAAQGLDGLETLHPDHGPMEVRRLRRLALELGLLETGGSDWHGPRGPHRGRLASQPVPYEWYLRLRQAVPGL